MLLLLLCVCGETRKCGARLLLSQCMDVTARHSVTAMTSPVRHGLFWTFARFTFSVVSQSLSVWSSCVCG